MKITSLKYGQKSGRVNVYVDGDYRFSLSEDQILELKIKNGVELSEVEIEKLENLSKLGKLYQNALNYCLVRPRSESEMWRYLSDRQRKMNLPIDDDHNNQIINRLKGHNYVNDVSFASHWYNNRFVKKGISQKRLIQELRQKGVSQEIIADIKIASGRTDIEELKKIVDKKMSRYPDRKKFMAYLARAGFNYDDINTVLNGPD